MLCAGQVSGCVWEADELLYWVESRRLQLQSVKSPSCELQAVHDDLDAFTVSLPICFARVNFLARSANLPEGLYIFLLFFLLF